SGDISNGAIASAAGTAAIIIHLRRRKTSKPLRCISLTASGAVGGCQSATVSTKGDPPYLPNANHAPPTNRPPTSMKTFPGPAYAMLTMMFARPKTMHAYRTHGATIGRL